jgi:hypothetical protein
VAGRFSDPFIQYLDSTPNVRSSARLFFYENGTTTKLDTYPTLADRIAGTNANTNPIVLNSTGHPSVGVFLQNQGYTVVLAPSGSDDPPTSPIWTADDVYGTDLSTVTETKVGSGSPTGVVAGTAGSAGVLPTLYWDYTNEILYVASVTGTAATTEWTALNASSSTPAVPPPQGYLTLVTGTPVITSDQAAKTAVFYTPDKGNLIPIYNGSKFTPTEFSELTLTLVASHVASTLYDIFVWSESGVVTVGTGPAWDDSAAGSGDRGTGASTTQLTRIKGLLVNAVSMTARNGNTTYTVGANLGTYVGSIFMDGTNGQVTCHRAFGQSRKFGIWNAYNRRPIILKAGDATASWTYGTDTFRASNNAAANSLTVFTGLAEELFHCDFRQTVSESTSTNEVPRIGIGWDSTTSASGFVGRVGVDIANGPVMSITAQNIQSPQIGISVVSCIEASAANTSTFHGGNDDMQLVVGWMG